MPRHWPVQIAPDREWLVGSFVRGLQGQVIIPLDQIEGMSDAEIGATVRSLKYDALYAVALEIADHWTSNGGVRLEDEDFEGEYQVLIKLVGEDTRIDDAIRLAQDAIRRRNERLSRQDRKRPQSMAGFIYLIRCGPYYKIGRTNKVERRMVQLGVQMPHPIEVIATHQVPDMVDAERELHAFFARKRLNGEWFDLDDDDLRTIETYFRGDDQDWYEVTEAGR